MSLSRAAIVDQLKEIVGADRVITDETVLKKNSIDRFRKFPDIHGIYTLPIPAAVVKLGSTEQVSRVLNFMNAHKINVELHYFFKCVIGFLLYSSTRFFISCLTSFGSVVTLSPTSLGNNL